MFKCIPQAVFDFSLVLARLHIDEVDDNQAAQVAQAQLTRDFIRRFAIGAKRRFLNIMAFCRAGGVDVD